MSEPKEIRSAALSRRATADWLVHALGDPRRPSGAQLYWLYARNDWRREVAVLGGTARDAAHALALRLDACSRAGTNINLVHTLVEQN